MVYISALLVYTVRNLQPWRKYSLISQLVSFFLLSILISLLALIIEIESLIHPWAEKVLIKAN